MKQYEPELGQMAFGQPWKQYECPEDVLSALQAMQSIWDTLTDTNDNPFSNTGNRYDGAKFKAHAYSWSDDEQEFNFSWCDVRISWYKYLGRGTTINRKMSKQELKKMLIECSTELFNNL